MSEQSLAANTAAAVAPVANSRRRWREIVASSGLPAEATALITTVIKRARLWRSEAREVAIELVAHFQDGLAAGRSASELTTTFGDAKQAARLIRRGKARCRPLWWQAWWWCSRGLLVILAVYLLLVLWQLWAKPEVKVNYLEIINKPVLAVPEADRAWPYYRDAYVKMELHSYWKDNFKNDHQQLKKIFAEDWRPGNKEWPALVEWLEKHRPELEKIREGASKSGYGFPIWIDRSKYSAQDLQVLEIEYDFSPTEIAQEPLYTVSLSQLQLNRRLALILNSDAIRATESGDAATALADIEALLHLSRQTEETPFLIGGLVAMAIDGIALNTAAEIITVHPELWSPPQLQQLAHRVAGQKFHPDAWWQYEQYFFRDMVQRVYTDDGHGDGRLTLAGIEQIRKILKLQHNKKSWLSREADNTEKALHVLALPALNLVAVSRKDMTERYQQLMDHELALINRPYWENKDQPDELMALHNDSVERIRYFLIDILFSATRAVRDALADHQGRKDGLLIGIALELYRREHGAWPETLAQLAPRYLPTLPVDLLTGKPLCYRLIDGKPCVYSVGNNLLDDGGQLYNPFEASDYPQGFYDETFRGRPAKEMTDWILWSLVPEHQRPLPLEPEKLEEENDVEAVPAAGG